MFGRGRRRRRRRYKICVCGDWMDAVYCVLFEVGGGRERGVWYYKHAFFRRWEYLMCWFRVFALLGVDDGASLFHIVNTGIIVLSRVAFLFFFRWESNVCAFARALGFSPRMWARAGVSA